MTPYAEDEERIAMLTSEDVKRQAKMLGADIVGIASMDRWEGAPIQMDPRQIMPEAGSMIVMAFRVMRGSLRGIEEGTFFSNYSSMGYGGLTYLYMPLVVINLCRYIEDQGYEAIPIGHQSDWRNIDNTGNASAGKSRPVAPGRAAPDVMVHLRIAGYLAGLGEIGYSKVFLTPEFGPRQRLGVVLTEAELEPDPIYDGPELCNRCMACVRECPGQAISAEKTVKVTLAGHEVEWGEIDCAACDIAFRGGKVAGEDEDDYYMEDLYGKHITRSPITPFKYKPRNLYNTGQAVCGGRGCMRACMISLEKRGVLKNKFKKEFRRRKPWSVDWSQPAGSMDAGADVEEREAD
ncbi:MAG: 4Fe-4S binding protein [Planctomycetes bacterium]|nr:4Fe-4S binding protein [Planctomycetota bacterium]